MISRRQTHELIISISQATHRTSLEILSLPPLARCSTWLCWFFTLAFSFSQWHAGVEQAWKKNATRRKHYNIFWAHPCSGENEWRIDGKVTAIQQTFWTSTPNWCVASSPWIQDLSLGWNKARMKLGSHVILVTKEVTLFKSTLKYAWIVSLRIARAISTWCRKCWTCETHLLRKHRRPQTYSKQFPCEMHSWLSDYPHYSIHYIIFPLWWV